MPGVAELSPVQVNRAGNAAVLTVIPGAAPQDDRTVALVHRIRDQVIPRAVAATGIRVLVGGETAASIDSATHLSQRLLPVIILVVGLSLLLLGAVFRSLAIPIKAAVMNLLSTGAAYGVIVAVFQWAGPRICSTPARRSDRPVDSRHAVHDPFRVVDGLRAVPDEPDP